MPIDPQKRWEISGWGAPGPTIPCGLPAAGLGGPPVLFQVGVSLLRTLSMNCRDVPESQEAMELPQRVFFSEPKPHRTRLGNGTLGGQGLLQPLPCRVSLGRPQTQTSGALLWPNGAAHTAAGSYSQLHVS